MFKLETGKVKLKPNQVLLVKFKKSKFKNKPVVNITTLENKNITLTSVKNDHFVVSNNTDQNVLFDYTATENTQKNIITVETPVPVSLFLNTTNYSTTINTSDFSQMIVFLDLKNLIETNSENTPIFQLVNQDQIISFSSITIDDLGNLSFNSEIFSFIYDNLNFDVNVTLQENNSISNTINLNFSFVQPQPLYSTTLDSYINYTSSSSLTDLRQHNITYIAQTSESSAGFFTPELSLNNEENYFKINSDISSSPNMSLYIVSYNNELIYYTQTPENPISSRILKGQIYGYNSGFFLEDQKSYYFWYSTNDSCWYYSEERFPLG